MIAATHALHQRARINKTSGRANEVDHSHPIVKAFGEALADHLNMAGAMGTVLPWPASKPDNPHEALGALLMINHVLGVAPMDATASAASDSGSDDIASLCKQLDEARASNDYDTADRIR